MRKALLMITITASLLLSACSSLGDVNNSLDYVNKATEHLNNLSNFAEEAPKMIQEAAVDAAVKKNLENELTSLKEELTQFNSMKDVPSMAEDLHQQLITKNEEVIAEINKLMANGQVALDKLEASELIILVNDLEKLMNRIESLGL
ncbi:phage-related minor tail protein [Peribacillus deserti]|uniref:Phage-related minor tail protein n=1 Tax=Peribacillus deserti TaxID=673318 RepID=A0ABS2QMV1_9BACI|nr:DUF6376 family protein [Peribacillus deserti]MBM7694506.1 phage-related minor tail protein [Peribacillus deserti]